MPFRDYEEFIAALNAHGARYLVVGAHAVAFHARPRATGDLDVLVDPTVANARKVLAALRDFFGGSDPGYSVEDVTDRGWILQLGVAPVRIDLMSAIPGLDRFGAAWKRRVDASLGRCPLANISLEELMAAKEAADRPQDRVDLRVLARARAARGRAGRGQGRRRGRAGRA